MYEGDSFTWTPGAYVVSDVRHECPSVKSAATYFMNTYVDSDGFSRVCTPRMVLFQPKEKYTFPKDGEKVD